MVLSWAECTTQLESSSPGESCSSPTHRDWEAFVNTELAKASLKHAIAFNEWFTQLLTELPPHLGLSAKLRYTKCWQAFQLLRLPVALTPWRHPNAFARAQQPWQHQPEFAGVRPSMGNPPAGRKKQAAGSCQVTAVLPVPVTRRKFPIYNW